MRARAVRATLNVWLTFGLALPLAPSAVAQAGQGSDGQETAQARRVLSDLRGLIDPTLFDLDALSLHMAFEEPETIADWVRTEVRFEAYAGLLRGPDGTLVARAGNALDQSVLLAQLLTDAGYDARVALGSLSEEEARTLVLSMFEVPSRPTRPADVQGAAALIAAATGSDHSDAEELLRTVAQLDVQQVPEYEEAVAGAESLLQQLGVPTDPDVTQELVDEARDYAWVEYRLSESNAWTPAHPAWQVFAEPPAVVADEHLEGEVPQDLLHRLRIEVTIERKRGDEFTTAQLMDPWERPVANLLGRAVVVGNTVLGESGATSIFDLGAELAEAAFYAPTLNGSLAPGAMAFDLRGNLVPPDAAVSAMAGVFQTAGERVGGAIGALGELGGDGASEDPFALTAQWIDIVLVAPGGEETRHRRTVFDRRAPGAREDGTGELLDESFLLDGILSTYALMTTGGRLSASFIADQLAGQADYHLEVIDRLANSGSASSEAERAQALMRELADYVPKDHLNLFAASDAIDSSLSGVAYRAQPSVIALVGALTPRAELAANSGIDIIANAKRVLLVDGDEVLRDHEAAVLAGVWDTIMEREFVESYGRVAQNAAGALMQGDMVLVRAPMSSASLRSAGVPDAALTAVSETLRGGYAVLIPTLGDGGTAEEPADAAGWSYWRVDLATGETLGMDAAGRGASMTEFLEGLIVGLTVNAALAVPSLIQCAASDASWLCYCDVIASGVLFSFAGALFSALVAAETALLVYVIVDITVVGPITTVMTPPICSSFATRDGRTLAGAGERSVCWAA